MNAGVFIGFGIGWFILGVIDLVFSFKNLVKKIDKKIDDWELKEYCFKNKIGAIIYLSFGTIWLVLGLLAYLKK